MCRGYVQESPGVYERLRSGAVAPVNEGQIVSDIHAKFGVPNIVIIVIGTTPAAYSISASDKEVQESAQFGPIPASALRPKIE